jgi:hypothetical protein
LQKKIKRNWKALKVKMKMMIKMTKLVLKRLKLERLMHLEIGELKSLVMRVMNSTTKKRMLR